MVGGSIPIKVFLYVVSTWVSTPPCPPTSFNIQAHAQLCGEYKFKHVPCALYVLLACWNAAEWLLAGRMTLPTDCSTCQNEIVALQCFLMHALAKRVFKPLSALQWDIICTDSSLNRRSVSPHAAHVIPLTTSALIDQLNIEWQIALTCHTGLRMLRCWFPPVDMKNIFYSINVCCQSAWRRRPGQEALTAGACCWQTAVCIFG